MSLRYGILGLLAEQPLHGYEVKTRYEALFGGTWELNIGQVYTTLQRLERDGLVDAVGERGDRGKQRYGLTECGGQATILTPQDHRDLLAGKDGIASSCGRETPMTEIRIVDDNGDELPRGETGEIVIKADAQARG